MAEKDVKKRVQDAMNEVGITAYAIAKSCSINERTIYQQTNGSSKLGVETVEALLRLCPNISAEWLLLGTGEMLLDTATTRQRHGNDTATSADIALLRDQLRRKDREIDGLYERIDELKRGTTPQTLSVMA